MEGITEYYTLDLNKTHAFVRGLTLFLIGTIQLLKAWEKTIQNKNRYIQINVFHI